MCLATAHDLNRLLIGLLQLNKLIDSSRVHVFDIITQYRAIFPDDILGSSSRDKEISGACILHSWLTQKISDFADTLGAYVPRPVLLSHKITLTSLFLRYLPELKEGVLIGNILEQSMYYATSLARVGLDFGGIVITSHAHLSLSTYFGERRIIGTHF